MAACALHTDEDICASCHGKSLHWHLKTEHRSPQLPRNIQCLHAPAAAPALKHICFAVLMAAINRQRSSHKQRKDTLDYMLMY